MEERTTTEQFELLLRHGVSVSLLYGDFYSSQDNYPFGVSDSNQRQRVFVHRPTMKLMRIEVSKKYLSMLAKPFTGFDAKM